MIRYLSGYKYQLMQDYVYHTGIVRGIDVLEDFIELHASGLLVLRAGYAWDGASGPAVDTKNFMRGSLVHDALYQLMRDDKLDATLYRKTADEILRNLCLEDGMTKLRAWWVYTAVRTFGSIWMSQPRKIEQAP